MKSLILKKIARALCAVMLITPVISLVSCDDKKGDGSLELKMTGRSDMLESGEAEATDLSVSAEPVTLTYNVTADCEWSIAVEGTDVGWLTVSPSGADGSSVVTVIAARNHGSAERNATLIVKKGASEFKRITITQIGFGANLSVVAPEGILKDEAGTVTLSIATNADAWQYVKTNGGWLTETSRTATEINFSVARNDGAQRTATLVFSLTEYPSVSKTVELIQQKKMVFYTITLNSPVADAVEDVAAEDAVNFNWTTDNVAGGFTFLLSANEDMSDPIVSRDLFTAGSSIDISVLDSILYTKGVALGATGDFYWTVKPQLEEETLTTPLLPRKMSVKRPTLPTDAITGDMFDIVFNPDCSAKDISAANMTVQTKIQAYPMKIRYNRTYKRYMAIFNPDRNGGTGSYFRFDYTTAYQDKLADGHSLECLVKFDVAYDGTQNYETKFFSSMGSGGLGFLVNSNARANELAFLNHTGAWNFDGRSGVKPDGSSYYHLVGTWDKTAKKIITYVNGVKKGEGATSSDTYKPPSLNPLWFGIGGDAGGSNIEQCFKGTLIIARIYDGVLTDVQAANLYSQLAQ